VPAGLNEIADAACAADVSPVCAASAVAAVAAAASWTCSPKSSSFSASSGVAVEGSSSQP
jgi:hypothetical protein